MTRSPRIVVVGSLNVDLVAYADRLPDRGETVAGRDFVQGFGGKGANQAVMAARFGLPVSMLGAVGDDPNGTSTLDHLRAEGIDVGGVATAGPTSGVASIWVDGSGQNRIVIVAGANALVDAAAAVAQVIRVRPTVVVGQFEIPQAATAAAFAAAREHGARTILNPAPGARIEPELLRVSDWLVPNETEFVAIGGRPLTGDPDADAAVIADLGERVGCGLIVTLGERGAILRTPDGALVRVPASVVRAVDTTGAGDAFVGAFAVGLGLGWSAEEAARLGCLAGADSVTRAGTQASYAAPDAARAMLGTIHPS